MWRNKIRLFLVLASLIAATTFIHAQPAYSISDPACPPNVAGCLEFSVNDPTQQAESGSVNVLTLGPDEFKDIFDSISQGSTEVGTAIRSFVNWLLGGVGFTGRSPQPSPPPTNPLTPTSFGNLASLQANFPNSADSRGSFRNNVLDGNTGSFDAMRSNPYDNPAPRYGDPPSGVDPHRPGHSPSTSTAPSAGTVGDPVQLGSGAFLLSQQDLAFPSPVRPLVFSRSYSSRSNQRSHLGSNWTHNWNIYLRKITKVNAPPDYPIGLGFERGVLIHDGARGADDTFLLISDNTYTALHGTPDTLESDPTGWTLRKPDGRSLRFNRDGYLTEDRDRFGNHFTIEYEPTPLYTLYRRHCQGRFNREKKKICQMLDYAFGNAYPRQFHYTSTFAWGTTEVPKDFITNNESELEQVRELVRRDMADGAANDPLSFNLSSRERKAIVEPWSSSNLTFPDIWAVRQEIANSLTTAIKRVDLFKAQGLTCDQLGLASRPIFDALRNDNIFTDDSGTVTNDHPSASEWGEYVERIINFNLALLQEVLYPGIVITDHEYSNDPDIEALLQASTPNPPAHNDVPEATRYSRSVWNKVGYDMLRRFIYQPSNAPTLRTRYSIDGGHRFRLVKVTDDLGRSLRFDYYDSSSGNPRAAGLLSSVSGPGGTKIEFQYRCPSWYPDFLNEMFLMRVERNDQPSSANSPFQSSPPRGYNFRYAWDTTNAEQTFSEWAWVVWRGVDLAQRPYAALAAAHYISSVADNIIGVERFTASSTIIESESAYVFHPLHHALDHVVAQRHGGSETQSVGGSFTFDGQTLIAWRSGLPQTTFEYSRLNLYSFLPPPVRLRYDLEALPSNIQPVQSTDQSPYFAPQPEIGDHPKIWRSRNTCDQIRSASTQYAGLSIEFRQATKLFEFNPFDDTDDYRLNLENIFQTRDRTRADSHRVCAWAATTSADATRVYHGLNFRGEVLVRATQMKLEPENGSSSNVKFFFEEFIYSEDGLLREIRRPLGTQPLGTQRWNANLGSTRMVYSPPRSLNLVLWRTRLNVVRVIETPRGGHVDDVTARFSAMTYEPVFNQTTRIRSGIIDRSGTERPHYETTTYFCARQSSDADRINPCEATRPRSVRMGDPSLPLSMRQRDFTWAPHGQLASLSEAGGQSITLDYYRTLGGPHPNSDTILSPTNRGMLARVRRARFDAAYGPPSEAEQGPCSLLRGPYQWLLTPTCQNPAQELAALGLAPAAVNAILAVNSDTVIDQRLAYSSLGHPQEVWGSAAHTKLWTDTDGRILTRTGPGNLRFEFIYTLEGQLKETCRRAPLGNVLERTVTEHDREGRITAYRHRLSYSRAASTHYIYSPGGRLVSITTPSGAVTEFEYNVRSQVAERRQRPSATEAINRLVRYSYSLDGELEFVHFGLDQTREDLGPVDAGYTYDGFRRLVGLSDEHQREWSFEYNERSQLERKRLRSPNPNHPDLWETTYSYDSHSRVATRTENGLDAETLTYTNDGRLVRRGAAGLGDTLYTYDWMGNLAWSRDAAGNQLIATHDPIALVGTTTRLAVGRDTPNIAVTTEETFDPRGMLASRVTLGSAGQTRSEQWTYSDSGELYLYTDPSGAIQELLYDFVGMPEAIGVARSATSSPNNNSATLYEYNKNSLNTSVTDPNSQYTATTYNTYGEITSQLSPGINTPTRYQYDGYGRLTYVYLPDGQRIRKKYSSRNYLTEEWLQRGSAPEFILCSWAYDAEGRTSHITEHNRVTATQPEILVLTDIDYDHNGRVFAETTTIDDIALRVESNWSLTTNNRWQRRLLYPSGTSWVSTLDELGRPESVRRIGIGPATSITFSWLGNLYAGRNHNFGAGVLHEAAQFDQFGARTGWHFGTAPDVNLSVRAVRDIRGHIGMASVRFAKSRALSGYAYSAAARLNSFWETLQPSSVAPPALADNFADDHAALAAGDALSAQRWNMLYDGHDALSSITPLDGGDPDRWQTPSRLSGYRLQSVSLDGTLFPISHDRSARVRQDGRFEYTYDARSRLVSARRPGLNGLPNVSAETYLYDGLGRLAAVVSETGQYSRFVYDGTQMIAAADQDGRLLWEAAWGPGLDRLIEFRRNADVLIPILDHRNSPVATFNVIKRQLTSLSTYDTFGRLTRLTDAEQAACRENGANVCASPLPFAFTTAFRSALTGLSYMRARWYSPQLLQFMTPDKAGYIDSFNPYAYAAFDPVNRWDPAGYSSEGFSENLSTWERRGLATTAGVEEAMAGLGHAMPAATTGVTALVLAQSLGFRSALQYAPSIYRLTEALTTPMITFLEEEAANAYYVAQQGDPDMGVHVAAAIGMFLPDLIGGPEAEGAKVVTMSTARLAKLAHAAEVGLARCIVCERDLFEKSTEALRSATKRGDTWSNFRGRLLNRLPEIKGIPIHHWLYPRSKYPDSVLDLNNLFIAPGESHQLMHQAVGAEGTVRLGDRFLDKSYFRMDVEGSELLDMFRFWVVPQNSAARGLAETGVPLTGKEIDDAFAAF